MTFPKHTDLVLDVVRAADPARAEAAAARLAALAPAGSGTAPALPFAEIQAMPAPSATDGTARGPGGVSNPIVSIVEGRGMDLSVPEREERALRALRDFEAVTLATFVKAMLPEEDSGVFGTGPGAGVWRAMLAEEIAKQMAEAGGIGIAQDLARDMKLVQAGRPAS